MANPDLEDQQNSAPQLQPCPICGRTFRPDALSRHQGVCEKNAARKRKVFDSSKQRAPEDAPPKQATSTSTTTTKTTKQRANPKPHNNSNNKAKSNWREKHEELIRTIKQARGQDDTTQEKRVPSDYVQCGGCGRHFNQRAAERHVPWCQESKKNSKSANTADLAKLQARVRYRPPQGKSRLLNRKAKPAQPEEAPRKAQPAQPEEAPRKAKPVEPEEPGRKSQLHSSPPALLDNRNKLDKNNNIATLKKRSISRERALVKSQPEFPHSIIKFKDKFPHHNYKRSCDLEESLTSEQLRELLSVSRISDIRGPKTVPGVRLSGGNNRRNWNNYSNRSSDVSRSSSSSGGSTNSSKTQASLPEVSSSEQLPWTAKPCWNGDLDVSVGSSGSSGSSLPPLSSDEEFVPLTFYCHQCGSKFPLVGAKYCCECGARRRGMGCVGQPSTG